MEPREIILSRLLAICKTIDGVQDAGRNTPDVTDMQRPAIILHDGHEELDERAGRPDLRGRLQLMSLAPQFNIHFNTGVRDIGPVSSMYRKRLLTAVFNDGELLDLLFDREIFYQGCTLLPADVQEGREARLEVELIFTYRFRVEDFVP